MRMWVRRPTAMAMLSDTERERIIETEHLKAEIRRELEAKDGKSRVSRFFGHPVALLIIGFLLTGILGGGVTYFWNERASKNQRVYLEKRTLLENKYKVLDEVTEAVAQTTTAAEDVLANYAWNWDEKTIAYRKDNWEKASRDWRIRSKIIKPKLRIYFKDARVYSTFDQIVSKRRQAGIAITNLLAPPSDLKARKHDTEVLPKQALSLVDEMLSQLEQLEIFMALELNSESD